MLIGSCNPMLCPVRLLRGVAKGQNAAMHTVSIALEQQFIKPLEITATGWKAQAAAQEVRHPKSVTATSPSGGRLAVGGWRWTLGGGGGWWAAGGRWCVVGWFGTVTSTAGDRLSPLFARFPQAATTVP